MQHHKRLHPREALSERLKIARAPRTASPPGRLLGNGRLRVLFTAAGTGGSWLSGDALTRWRGDRVQDGDGWFLYLRDLESGAFWSAGAKPVAEPLERYEVQGGPGSASITRLSHGIESRLDVWVDAERPVECRRLTLHNRSARTRRIEITSLLEVVIHDPRADAAHPAFSKLFVETEAIPARGTLLARRRPRDTHEAHPWLAQSLGGRGALEFATDRGRFVGRGRDLERPLALTERAPLLATTGAVLDPVLALRRTVSLAPGERAELPLLLAAAESRERALALLVGLGDPAALAQSAERAEARARERLSRLGIEEAEAVRLEALGVALLYGDPRLRPSLARLERVASGWGPMRALALDPESPLVLVEPDASPAARGQAFAALRLWRDLGFEISLVAFGGRASEAGPGARVLPLTDATAETLDVLRVCARLVVSDRLPDLASGPAETAPAAAHERGADAVTAEAGAPPRATPAGAGAREPLRSFNGHGGFSEDGREYVIRMERAASGLKLPPRPWVNVLANADFGTIVSETGAACTWYGNSREFRLTPWSNDPVRDPHDEALYLRDVASGEVWSALPGPVPGACDYEMRHGFGYSRCRHLSGALEVDAWIWVPPDQAVKVVELRITNHGAAARRLSLTSYQRLVLGGSAETSARTVVTSFDRESEVLLARQRISDAFLEGVAYGAAVTDVPAVTRFTADRESFLGRAGSARAPAALAAGDLDGRCGAGLDPCFALQLDLGIGAGETRVCAFLLGHAKDAAAAGEAVARLREPKALAASLGETRGGWERLLERVRIETPVDALDLMANGWLLYQTLACRLWGRSAFYQSGGAFGFRDQLQDAAAFAAIEPDITRRQILLHAAHQFEEGDVLHWWHPPLDLGLRTRFADDLLWLPYVTAHYVATTGDHAILDQRVPFRRARSLEPEEDEAYLASERGGEASLYEHCCRALDRSLTAGAHGLPLFGGGDWNDGMNRVGRQGRGESVWMGFFLFRVLEDFRPLCDRRGDGARAERYREWQERLRSALESGGWDGAWYRRGYYDDGAPLGSRASDECQIDALAQAWAVLSGAVDGERARAALAAADQRLVSTRDKLVRLLTPPFDAGRHDPGYIKGYVRGVRENGGQYTHAALWVARAMAELSWRDRAATLLEMLSPVSHASTADQVAVYQVEPYVVAADVYGEPPHVGRGGWTWYTGSSGWMFRVIVESLLGVRIEGGRTLSIRPAIPDSWSGFRVELRPDSRGTGYHLEVVNPKRQAGQVVEARVDGASVPILEGAARVTLVEDGAEHRVVVVMGPRPGAGQENRGAERSDS